MSKPQILVAEDERVVAAALQYELECMGYEVPAIASSGQEALEKASQTHPNLILMDICLQGDMDGIEAAGRIRDRFDIPVVYLTAYADETILHRARITEPFGYLLKPYVEKELQTTIEMALYKHRMEQLVKDTERWLAATLESIHDAVIATDARQCIRFINPVAEALTGWRSTDAFGKDITEVCQLVDERNGVPLTNLPARAMRESTGIALPEQTLLLAKNERGVPVEGTIAPIPDEQGVFTGVVVALRDVSERRRMEAVQRRSEEHLRQAQKMEAVTRLAGSVAHDFNNLLTVILGNTSLYLAGIGESDSDRPLLERVEAAALRAADVVEQLQRFAGGGRSALRLVNLNTTINEALSQLRRKLDARTSVDFKPDGDLWRVQADPGQWQEVLLHLALNAQDAMPGGGRLLIETSNAVILPEALLDRPAASAGEFVRLRVSDTGSGIPAAARPRIFEPFFTTKERGKGVGLGLALVYGIVEQHHGWIECISEEGQGTRFDIYLPRSREKVEPAVAPPASAAPARVGAKTVLLADDEPMIRDLGRAILESKGYNVLLAEDGKQAVDVYEREKGRIDLVVLDLAMPQLTGDAVFRQLAEIDPRVRVLFSSGCLPSHLKSTELPGLGFVSKPYRLADFTQAVENALGEPSAPAKDTLLLLINRLDRAVNSPSVGHDRDWLQAISQGLEAGEVVLQQRVDEPEGKGGRFAGLDLSRAQVARKMNDLRRRRAEVLNETSALKLELQKAHQASLAAPEKTAELALKVREPARQLLTAIQNLRNHELALILESVSTDIGGGD